MPPRKDAGWMGLRLPRFGLGSGERDGGPALLDSILLTAGSEPRGGRYAPLDAVHDRAGGGGGGGTRLARLVRGAAARPFRSLLVLTLVVAAVIVLRGTNGGTLRDSRPPTYARLWQWERELPQHDLELPLPEGRAGRYVRFSNQVREKGWNNVLSEILLCTEVARQADRAYVFEHYTWQARHYPWPLYPWQVGVNWSPRTPLNALIAGPTAGGNWDAADPAPRSVSVGFWEEACPPHERYTINSTFAKTSVRGADGDAVFRHYVDLIKHAPARCVEITAAPRAEDDRPQLFDVWFLSSLRSVATAKLFLHSPTSRLLGTSPLVQSAVVRNAMLFAPRARRAPDGLLRGAVDPFQRMMAVHIRRGDFGRECPNHARRADVYYQWNLWPQNVDKFVVPPGAGGGSAKADAHEYYRQHCYPTVPEMLGTIRSARDAYLGGGNRTLDVLYVATNAAPAWMDELKAALAPMGWTTVVATADLRLDEEQTDVGMAVDMELARLAAVFIGNGFSSFTSSVVHRRLVDNREPEATRFW